MSNLQPLKGGDRVVTRKRNWPLFGMIVLAGVTLAAALFGIRYLPEVYQNLIFATVLGGVLSLTLCQFLPFDLRSLIGVVAGSIAFATYAVTSENNLMAGWVVCGASALTSIVIFALHWSDPLPLDPDVTDQAPK